MAASQAGDMQRGYGYILPLCGDGRKYEGLELARGLHRFFYGHLSVGRAVAAVDGVPIHTRIALFSQVRMCILLLALPIL